MADNTARMNNCAKQLDKLGVEFERFEAINGKNLTDDQIVEVYDAKSNRRKFRNPLIRGELGCYLSHIELWKRVAKGTIEGAVILEDDISVSDDLAKVLQSLCQSQDDWDLVKLYTRRPHKKMLNPRDLSPGRKLATPFNIPNTTLGYVIRKSGAKQLLAQAIPFCRPIDEDHKRFWEHGLNVKLVLPPPLQINAEAQVGTTIEASRKLTTGRLNFGQGWRNLKYRLQYLSLLYFNRMFSQ